MFGKYQAIFRSRWRALLWSAGVLMTAYCTVPAADETAQHLHAEAKERPAHSNPWALDKDG